MYITIQNTNSQSVRVRISDTESLNIRAKSSVSIGISPKFYRQLKQDPKIKLWKSSPYDYFRKVLTENTNLKHRIKSFGVEKRDTKKLLVENEKLKNEIKRLKQELKELQSKGIVTPNTVEGLSHLLNIKIDKVDDDLKMAIFQKIIDENVRIREHE